MRLRPLANHYVPMTMTHIGTGGRLDSIFLLVSTFDEVLPVFVGSSRRRTVISVDSFGFFVSTATLSTLSDFSVRRRSSCQLFDISRLEGFSVPRQSLALAPPASAARHFP